MKGLSAFILSIVAVIGALWGIGFTVTQYLDENFGGGTSALFFVAVGAVILTLVIVLSTMHFTNKTHRDAGDDVVAVVGGLKQAFTADTRSYGQYRVIDARAQLEAVKSDEFARRQQTRLITQVDARDQRRQWAQEDKQQETEQAAAGWEVYDPADTDDHVQYYYDE